MSAPTPIERITPDGHPHARRHRVSARHHRIRDRVRCDDRVAAADGYPRARRAGAGARRGQAGPRNYLGLQVAGFPEPVHDHRSGQPVGAVQHAGGDRAACRVDHRLHRPYAQRRLDADRADPGSGRIAGSRRSTRPPTPHCCHRPNTPGISAPTSPASRACSCPMPAAWRTIARSAPGSRRTGTRAFG